MSLSEINHLLCLTRATQKLPMQRAGVNQTGFYHPDTKRLHEFT